MVDEEKGERGRVRGILEQEGYRVLEASGFAEAVRTQAEHPHEVDMLLTTIALPGNNGYELALALCGVEPALKVLFASGPTGAEVSRFYNMPLSGPHLLSKPIERTELVARVNRAFHTGARQLYVQRAS